MENFPRRGIYFSIGFLLPAIMLICATVIACANVQDFLGYYVGSIIGSIVCVIAGLIAIANDSEA